MGALRNAFFRVTYFGSTATGEASKAWSFAPLAGTFGSRTDNLDPVLFASGMAVLSAGLVVLRAARGEQTHPSRPTLRPSIQTGPQGQHSPGDRELLLDALASAAGTIYSIAGHLPGDASARAVRNADDLRELVWMNRGGR